MTSTGAAGCVSLGGGESEGGDGTDGGSDGGGDGSGDGSSSDGSDGGNGDGGMTEADQSTPSTPTPTPTPTPQGTQSPIDPIIGFPTTYLLAALFSGFELVQFGLGQVASEDGGTERIHSPGDGLVFEGSFDTGSVETTVSEAGASEAGTYEGYTLYESGSGDDAAVLAVSGEALVQASAGEEVSDPRAVVESTIDAGAGNATRYGADRGAYEDLVTALPTDQIMGVNFSPDGGIDPGSARTRRRPPRGWASGTRARAKSTTRAGSSHRSHPRPATSPSTSAGRSPSSPRSTTRRRSSEHGGTSSFRTAAHPGAPASSIYWLASRRPRP
ncbi:hypothetical protein BRC70_06490 [Halobacteriales archaeon QH_6_68_27]|nr:MAG: hypothetical protein BRC70_06490 [Halobacteriales archaeon QH_6_68_27]